MAVCDEVVKLLPSSDDKHLASITGFQLKDILAASYSLDDLKEGVKERLAANNDKDVYARDSRIIADLALDERHEEETPEERKKRWGTPKITFNEILEEFGLVEECKEKIKEHDITDDLLWHTDANELVGLLELKKFKHTKDIPEKIKKILADHNKECERLDEEKKKMTKE